MGEDELIANLFRISPPKQKLINENIKGEKESKEAHFKVGKKVRKTIEELGGKMLEKLPTLNINGGKLKENLGGIRVL